MSLSGPIGTAEEKMKQELDEEEDFDLDKEVKKAAAQQPRKIEKKSAPVADDDDDLESFKKMLDEI
jgi:hypothetical protein